MFVIQVGSFLLLMLLTLTPKALKTKNWICQLCLKSSSVIPDNSIYCSNDMYMVILLLIEHLEDPVTQFESTKLPKLKKHISWVNGISLCCSKNKKIHRKFNSEVSSENMP